MQPRPTDSSLLPEQQMNFVLTPDDCLDMVDIGPYNEARRRWCLENGGIYEAVEPELLVTPLAWHGRGQHDTVSVFQSSEAIDGQDMFWKNAYRLAKPGGVLCGILGPKGHVPTRPFFEALVKLNNSAIELCENLPDGRIMFRIRKGSPEPTVFFAPHRSRIARR